MEYKDDNEEKNDTMAKMVDLFQQQMEQNRIAAEEARKQAEESRKQASEFMTLIASLVKKPEDGSTLETPASVLGKPVSEVPLINALGNRIPVFEFDLEENRTFPRWFSRYSDVFELEGSTLSDQGKRQLLVGKLSEACYEQLTASINPRKCSELSFNEVVEQLNCLFDVKRSIFARRFACMQMSMMDETPTDYTNRVNEMCERAKLDELKVEDWKVFFFIKGLDRTKDERIRNHFLQFMEVRSMENKSTSIKDLYAEWMRMLSLKKDSEEIQSSKSSVNQVYGRNSRFEKGSSEDKKKAPFRSRSLSSKKKPVKPVECWKCGKIGHMKQDCRSKDQRKAQSVVANCTVNAIRKFLKVKIMDEFVDFQVDTGSDITLIGRSDWERLGRPTLSPSNVQVRCANGSVMEIDGKFKSEFEMKGSCGQGWLYVREDGNLLGLDFINQSDEMKYHMEMMVNQVAAKETAEEVAKDLFQRFPEVFREELGKCGKEKATLQLKKEAVPVYKKARPVPYGSIEVATSEIERLVGLGVIEKVTHSRWAAPVVLVKKSNGKTRMCADFRTGLNANLEEEIHPLPTPQDIFANLNGGQIFSQVDLADAYLQVELDEESQKLCVINTHLGLFKYNRLPFGVKTAPAIFQQIVDKMISGLEGVACYLDDIIVIGRTDEEHRSNLVKLFERINEYGFHVRLDKCSFAKKQIEFLGFILDKNGRRPNPAKTKVIREMLPPDNAKKLQSFMGMITYYSAFIPGMKAMRGPLDKLLQKEAKWNWTELEQSKFDELKNVLASDLNLAHFDPKLPIVVAADACEYGIGCVISHKMPDGSEKPIAHAAKSLAAAEKNYSQIEKEALGLVYAIKRFHKYIFGRRFVLKTDHKPLLAIFGEKRDLPVHSQNRLVRWATMLMGYDFSIEYVRTDKFGQADGLSRMMQRVPLVDEDVVVAEVHLGSMDYLAESVRKIPVTVSDIQNATGKDDQLRKIVGYVETGRWPGNKMIDKETKWFFEKKMYLSVSKGCLLWRERVVIPKLLQNQVMKQLHESHPGIERMKQLARTCVYWPGIDSDCTEMVNRCRKCQECRKSTAKVPLEPWPQPERPWQRVHIDYAGPDNGVWYLVAVDALTKWPEVSITRSISASSTVSMLEAMFARNGYPETIVSDNGTQFVSESFSRMCTEFGIEHLRSPAYHPQSNGQAERFVDTLKRGLRKLKGEGSVSQGLLNQFLLYYRSTPMDTIGGKSPAELHVGRKLRTKLSLLIPRESAGKDDGDLTFRQKSMKGNFDKKHGVKSKVFKVGDSVLVKVYSRNNWNWEDGVVKKVVSPVMYLVEQDGKTKSFHANQMLQNKLSLPREDNWFETMTDIFALPSSHVILTAKFDDNDINRVPGPTSRHESTSIEPIFSSPNKRQNQQSPKRNPSSNMYTASPPKSNISIKPCVVIDKKFLSHDKNFENVSGVPRSSPRKMCSSPARDLKDSEKSKRQAIDAFRGILRTSPRQEPPRRSQRTRKPTVRFDPSL